MIQTIDISLIPSENKPVINVSQFDNISRVLRFNVFDDAGMEVPHVFDNTETVLLNIRKNDNNIVVITGVIVSDIDPETQEVTGHYITFELTDQACACVGSNYGEVSITSGDEVIGSCNFKLIVERSPLAGGVSSQTAIDNLTTQIEQITEEVIGENYYTKTETDNLLDDKADITDLPDMSDYYTKTETDNLLDDKADITDLPDMSDYYTKTETDNLLDDKADVSDLPDMSDYYTKTETDDLIYDILPVGSASGSIASFNTALVEPLVSCDVDENATLLTKCGKNLFPTQTVSGTRYENANVSLKGGLTYTFSALVTSDDTDATRSGIIFFYFDGTIMASVYLNRDTRQSVSFTPAKDVVSVRLFASDTQVHSEGDDFTFSNIQIEVGTVATDFELYKKTEYSLPLSELPETYLHDNNFFADIGDVSLTYKDTIGNYIDTRVNTVSNRSLSMMRTLETLEKSVSLDKTSELERGDNNDDNAR